MSQDNPQASYGATGAGAPGAPVQSYAPPAAVAAQPDLVKRFLAVLIDGVLVAVVVGVLGLVSSLIGSIAGLGLWLLRDIALEGRSPGKRVIGLHVATQSGAPLTPNESVLRNSTMALGYVGNIVAVVPVLGWLAALAIWAVAGLVGLYECFLVLTNKPRLGDTLAHTRVVVDQPTAVVA